METVLLKHCAGVFGVFPVDARNVQSLYVEDGLVCHVALTFLK